MHDELVEETINALKKLQGVADIESAHQQADDILTDFLTDLGYANVVAEYQEIEKWYA